MPKKVTSLADVQSENSSFHFQTNEKFKTTHLIFITIVKLFKRKKSKFADVQWVFARSSYFWIVFLPFSASFLGLGGAILQPLSHDEKFNANGNGAHGRHCGKPVNQEQWPLLDKWWSCEGGWNVGALKRQTAYPNGILMRENGLGQHTRWWWHRNIVIICKKYKGTTCDDLCFRHVMKSSMFTLCLQM